ncbi:hypothetical protein pb186bvf_000315 [Paramecium bursaria]
MNIDFPDNLKSSQGELPEKQTDDWHEEVKFLHYMPKNKKFGREQQVITKQIKLIELSYKNKVDEMVSQLLNDEQNTLNIIPKKANIDLKRALQPKLDKLKKQTERSIVQLLNAKYQKKAEAEPEKKVEQDQGMEIEQLTNVFDREIELDDDFSDDYETQ